MRIAPKPVFAQPSTTTLTSTSTMTTSTASITPTTMTATSTTITTTAPLPPTSRPATPSSPQAAQASLLAAKASPSPDGRAFAAARLRKLGQLARLGVPTAVVFDLDNTVFDTRHRTLQAGLAFDAEKGTSFFADKGAADMGVGGKETAAALGLTDPHAADFVAFWDVFFWTPDNLAHDAPIADMVALAKAAQEAGAQVKFLTGRIQSFQSASLLQLRAAGLNVAADDVMCKPDLGTRTGPFKATVLSAMQAEGVELGFFVTEGSRDLLHLEGALKALPLLRLECHLEDTRAVRHLPTWPSPF